MFEDDPIATDEEIRKLRALGQPQLATRELTPDEMVFGAERAMRAVADLQNYPRLIAERAAKVERRKLRIILRQLHSWDVAQGWDAFNTILAELDEAVRE